MAGSGTNRPSTTPASGAISSSASIAPSSKSVHGGPCLPAIVCPPVRLILNGESLTGGSTGEAGAVGEGLLPLLLLLVLPPPPIRNAVAPLPVAAAAGVRDWS